MQEVLYKLHNTARDPQYRVVHAQLPGSPKLNILLGGGAVRVGRHAPTTIHSNILHKLMPEIRRLVDSKQLRVTTADGRDVDLVTMEVKGSAKPVPPLPEFAPDSIANDSPHFGLPHASMYQGELEVANPPTPAVVQQVLSKKEEPEELSDDELEAATAPEAVPATEPVVEQKKPEWLGNKGKKR
jgi:hypothetical protein